MLRTITRTWPSNIRLRFAAPFQIWEVMAANWAPGCDGPFRGSQWPASPWEMRGSFDAL
jgi:hypothetical protein